MAPEAKNEFEKRILRNISESGWHCTSVNGNQEAASFTYTVGLHKSYGKPELILFGLASSLAYAVIADVANRFSKGEAVPIGKPVGGLVDGYDCLLLDVDPKAAEEYLLSAKWYYGAKGFPTVQIVWPSLKGLFPWDPQAGEEFRKEQTVLGSPPDNT